MRACRPVLLFLALLLCSSTTLAAPKAVLWDRWTAHDPKSTISVDHKPWDTFLENYLVEGEDGVNRLSYGKVSSADRLELDGYVRKLAEVPVSRLGRDEQRAYWINLYNALTVSVILEHYPVKSIRDIDISPGFFSDGPWGKKLVTIEGVGASLDDMEHRILRPIWKDPRVHYAVNCASIGCPNLQPQAFTAKTADALLEKGAREYVNHPRGVRVKGRGVEVSSIYRWFAADFGGNDREVITHLKGYADSSLRKQLEGKSQITGYDYDWALNDAS